MCIRSHLPLFALLLAAGCDDSRQNLPGPTDSGDALAECVELGFVPDTWEMDRCLAADTRVQRLVLVDQATYGTF